MGLFRLVYKIGRMVFRDFLFKIPKKYLVIIIVFLTMFLLKNSVLGYSVYDTLHVDDVSTDLVFYKQAYLSARNSINTFISAPYLNDNSFRNNMKFEMNISLDFNRNSGWGYMFYTDSIDSTTKFNFMTVGPTYRS